MASLLMSNARRQLQAIWEPKKKDLPALPRKDYTAEQLLKQNEIWAKAQLEKYGDADYFRKVAQVDQKKVCKWLWIGCSDSRTSPNDLLDLDPAQLFVHRNIANVVDHTDINLMSVLQYAVEHLEVENIVVCGHYGCGGIKAAMGKTQLGLIDGWLRNIRDVLRLHKPDIDAERESLRKPSPDRKCYDQDEIQDRIETLLAIYNVQESVNNICKTTFVQNAWRNKRNLTVRGWFVDLADGRVRDLQMNVTNVDQVDPIHRYDPPESECKAHVHHQHQHQHQHVHQHNHHQPQQQQQQQQKQSRKSAL